MATAGSEVPDSAVRTAVAELVTLVTVLVIYTACVAHISRRTRSERLRVVGDSLVNG